MSAFMKVLPRRRDCLYPRALSPSAVTRLFQRIELRDVQRYFSLMRSYLQEDEDNKIILALDSTSISSYSTNLTHIEYGKNKETMMRRS